MFYRLNEGFFAWPQPRGKPSLLLADGRQPAAAPRRRKIRYDSVSLTDHLNTAAGEFEQSYLQNPGTPECDTEDEVYED